MTGAWTLPIKTENWNIQGKAVIQNREFCSMKTLPDRKLRRKLLDNVRACPNVTILEQMTMLDFIETKNTCLGVTARDESENIMPLKRRGQF